jgi:hypothetical protein
MTKIKKLYPTISHVYFTKYNESIWNVKFSDGKRRNVKNSTINNKRLITDKTTWEVERISCPCRYNGKKFRIVYWKGFKEPTEEPVDFVLNVYNHDQM